MDLFSTPLFIAVPTFAVFFAFTEMGFEGFMC